MEFHGTDKKLIAQNNLGNKVFLQGKKLPEELDALTRQAYIGLNLVENTGLNQYYSLRTNFRLYTQWPAPDQHELPRVQTHQRTV